MKEKKDNKPKKRKKEKLVDPKIIDVKEISEKDELTESLIKYYANHLTMNQDKIILAQISKKNNESVEDYEIETYKIYKHSLTEISKKGLSFLIVACSLIETTNKENKLKELINYCNKYQINV